MYAPGVRKLQTNSSRIDDSLDFIRADEVWSQLAGRHSQRDVFSSQPHLLARVICRGGGLVALRIARLSLLGLQESLADPAPNPLAAPEIMWCRGDSEVKII